LYNRQHALERWLDLLALAARPRGLDDPAVALLAAQSFASPAQWDHYFLCSSAPCHAADATPASTFAAIRGWQGANELERRETHSRFVEAYRDILAAQADVLPLDMYMTIPVKLGTYSAEHGGMPLEWQAQISQ